jgi:DNA uptake protein ComE-like DNA-binding protein
MVLFVLMIAEIIVLVWLRYIPSTSDPIDFSAFKKEIDAFYAEQNAANIGDEKDFRATDDVKIAADVSKGELFYFNPNELPEKEWMRLGFSEKQVRSIKNYESKGGSFRSKDDVKKMYAISESEFNRIAPYIDLPKEKSAEPKTFKKISKPFLTVDIGTADTSELNKLPMVGEILAFKIYNYREKLGGFYSVSQLKEVYGLRDSAYMIILPHLILKDSSNLRKMNLNTAGYEELNMHPYINSKIANVVLAYRKQHGPFQDITDLQKVALVDAELYRKIAPYLKVE